MPELFSLPFQNATTSLYHDRFDQFQTYRHQIPTIGIPPSFYFEECQADTSHEFDDDMQVSGFSRNVYYSHRWKTNRRKRERNVNINRAFAQLRDRIPNVPSSAKISKIKILQLASRYIAYLTSLLNNESTGNVSLFALRPLLA